MPPRRTAWKSQCPPAARRSACRWYPHPPASPYRSTPGCFFSVTRSRMRYQRPVSKLMNLVVSFSDASMPSRLEMPTSEPPQPPTIRLQKLVAHRHRQPAEEVRAHQPHRVQRHLVVHLGEVVRPVNPGERVAHAQDDHAVLAMHFAVARKRRSRASLPGSGRRTSPPSPRLQRAPEAGPRPAAG